MATYLANPRHHLRAAAAAAAMPPPPVDYVKWAQKNVFFRPERSDFPGYYNPDVFPFFNEILKALSPEEPCRTVSFKKSAQLGGTILALIWTMASLDVQGGDFMYITPTLENAKRWSKSKFEPLANDIPSIRAKFPRNSKEATDTVLRKDSKDGLASLLISGANSGASLSMESRKNIVLDDLAKWINNDAGDPEGQAESRAQSFLFAKIFKNSTPLLWPGCRITTSFNQGSQEYFYVPCPQCEHKQILEWENFKEQIDSENTATACFHCVECGFPIEEHHRSEMMKKGEWIAHNPKMLRKHRSFFLWSAYSPLASFERIADSFLSTNGDTEKLQRFHNDDLGEPLVVEGSVPDWETLKNTADDTGHQRGRVPAGYYRLFLGIDCQDDRVEWLVRAYGRGNRTFVVDHGVIHGHISEDEARTQLKPIMKRKFRNPYGHDLPIFKTAIDGNYSTEDVFDWIKKAKLRKSEILMVRGAQAHEVPMIEAVGKDVNDKGRKSKRKPWHGWFYNLAVSKMKLSLYRSLRTCKDPDQRNAVAFPAGFEDEFYEQLTAEAWVGEKNKKGIKVYAWKKQRDRNEVLDMMNYADGAAIHSGVRRMTDADWDVLEAELTTPLPDVQGDFEDLLGLAAPTPEPAKAPEPKPEITQSKAKGDVKLSERERMLAERAARRSQLAKTT
ncbi:MULTISPECIES: terminase gpA endonuclease subunit [unclassified Pseudovibrio]|uniref:phage terminase large subunit family protein n=1 Tax=unclassified Pseudovibrio TaxID=2627060 RepID=UPI0009EE3C7E|nr:MULTISPECIES: terminase gpA endonuclease subunit [unclassified Pseudovibrio]